MGKPHCPACNGTGVYPTPRPGDSEASMRAVTCSPCVWCSPIENEGDYQRRKMMAEGWGYQTKSLARLRTRLEEWENGSKS